MRARTCARSALLERLLRSLTHGQVWFDRARDHIVMNPRREKSEEKGATMATQLAPGLARKVKKVLETRADTPETIACLKGLSEFYGENTPAARRGARSHRPASNLHPVSSL